MVLEEAPRYDPAPSSRSRQLLPISGRSPAVLETLGRGLADRLEAWRLPRTLAVVVVFLGMGLALLLALLLLVPILERTAMVPITIALCAAHYHPIA